MRNDLQRHKKSDGIKWALTIIAFLLIAVMLTGVCLQVFGTGKLKPSEWFFKSKKEQLTSDLLDNGGAFIGDTVENGVKLVSNIAAFENSENIGNLMKLPQRCIL